MPNQDDNTSKRNDAVSADQSGEALTVTERDILRLVAYGLTNKEIASQLCLAEKAYATARKRRCGREITG